MIPHTPSSASAWSCADWAGEWLKRLMDLVLSTLTLTILLPLFAGVAAMIKLDGPGPVFFRQVRVGRWGRSFRVFKFRTMVMHADELGGPSTPRGDPRITRVGRVLRRLNLDELPQLVNVLMGDMSIVGPRPEVPQYVALFSEDEKAILTVKPGITDWATLWIRNEGQRLAGSPDPERTYLEEIWPVKHRLALEYVRNRSLWVDLKIILLTLRVHLVDRFRPSA